MRRLDRYILTQIAGPFLFFVLVFTGVIWLSQSLRVIDTVVNNGQSALVFLEFVALLLPMVLAIVLPVAAFAGTLYAINRLFGESEVVAMLAAGQSGPALLRPVAIFAALVTVATFALTLYAMPAAQRVLRDRVAEVRGDIAAAFLREGSFLTPADGLSVYIREAGRPGEMLGIFVHDERGADERVTYTAERALLLQDGDGPRLVMFDGLAQVARFDQPETLQVLRFSQLAYDLSALAGTEDERARKPSEMFLPELLAVRPEEAGPRGLGPYRAEAHEALSAPFYALALPMLATAIILSAGFRRQGVAGRVLGAVALAGLLRLGGLAIKGLVVGTAWAWPLLYLPPLAAIAGAIWLLGRGTGRRRAGG